MATIGELAKAIGKHGMYRINGLAFEVVIMAAKQAYGQVRYAIQPVRGEGLVYVNADSVRIVER